MVRVNYDSRILCDSSFFNSLKELSIREQAETLRSMMYIRNTSEYHKRDHNIILKSEYSNISEMQEEAREYLPGAVKEKEEPDFLKSDSDRISKNVRYAIYLTQDIPYRSCLLTSQSDQAKYLANAHYKDKTLYSVRILSGTEAISLIKAYFRLYENARDRMR